MSQDQIRDAVTRAVREDGRSLTAIAQASGIPRPNLSDYLHKRARLRDDSLDRLCDALGLRLSRG